MDQSFAISTKGVSLQDTSLPAVTVEVEAEPAVDDLDFVSSPSFEAFYRDERTQIARGLMLTLRDSQLAIEAVDEAMTRAYARWGQVSTFDNPSGWVYRVGVNWATSIRNRHRKRPQPPIDRGPMDVSPVGEPDVLAALGELDIPQRSVVVCRFYLGLSEAETAKALGIRPGTVKSRLHRALRRLETRLDHLRPEENS